MRICPFLKIVPSYLSLVTRHRKYENFDIMTSFDPLKCVLGGLNLHPEEFLCTPTYFAPTCHPSLVFKHLRGAEIAAGTSKLPRQNPPNILQNSA